MVDNVWLIDNMKSLIHVFMYKIKVKILNDLTLP